MGMEEIDRKKMIQELRRQKKELKEQLKKNSNELALIILSEKHEMILENLGKKEKIKWMIKNIDEQIKSLQTDTLSPIGRGKVRLRTGKDDPF